MIRVRFRSRPRPRSRLAPALAVALTALVLAACGGSGAAATATASATPTASSTAPVAAASASPTDASTTAAFPRTVQGSEGTSATLPARPQRVISFSPGATEILFAIGAGPQLVAVDRYSNYPAAAKRLPQLATYLDTTDPEQALALSPDLIVTSMPQQAKQFDALHVPTLLLDIPSSIDGVYAQMQAIGDATGHEAGAQALIARSKARISAVVQRIADVQQGPKVFFELDHTLYTAAPDSFVGSMLTLLKARNVAAGAVSQFPQLTAEAVIAANPDVILLADAAYGESAKTVAARPGWSSIAAVVNHRVIPVNADLTNRPGARIADAVEALARALYPDRFPAAATVTPTPTATSGAQR